MANITIAGKAVVITSSLKLEDIRKVEKYRPEALILMGGKDDKEQIFRIGGKGSGTGVLGKYGAEFANATRDEAKLACITMVMEDVDDVQTAFKDKYGAALLNLNKLEGQIPAALEAIDAEVAEIDSHITVIV